MWQAAFFVFPLVFLATLTFWSVSNFRLEPDFTASNWVKVMNLSFFWRAFGTTALFAAGVAALASVLAFPASYHISFRMSARARRIAIAALLAPFFTSYLVRIYSWQTYLGDEGIVNSLLKEYGMGGAPMLNNAFGSIVGYLTLCLPLVILLQILGFGQVDRAFPLAAQNLGCGPFRTVFAVVIPAARPGLTIAALFAFIMVFGDFASPIYLGGATSQTMSILITDLTKAGQQWPRAAVAAVMMMVALLAAAFSALKFAYQRP